MGSFFDAAFASPPVPPERVRRDRPGTTPGSRERKPAQEPLQKALGDLDRALDEALQALRAGHVPASATLEQARKALLQALASSDRGALVPALQRFLRSAAVDLVAALSTPNVTAASLLPLFERHLQAFTAARQEADTAWGGRPTTPVAEVPFWEGSV